MSERELEPDLEMWAWHVRQLRKAAGKPPLLEQVVYELAKEYLALEEEQDRREKASA
jgi:hypothetical protein